MELVVLAAVAVAVTWLAVRALEGERHPVTFGVPFGVLAILGVVLGYREVTSWTADRIATAAVSAIAGRPVVAHCQRFMGAATYAGSELGRVDFPATGLPQRTDLTYETCDSLRAFATGDQGAPRRDEVVAVHVLAHEAFHLRGVHSESAAECMSLQRTALVAEAFGATPEQAAAAQERYYREVYPMMPPDYLTWNCVRGSSLDLDPASPAFP